MRLVNESGSYSLDQNGMRVPLSAKELNLFKRMNPMGRKIILRKRAKERMDLDQDDSEAQLILLLTRLPIQEWNFQIPN